jgi:hypothetical protein
MRPDYLPDVYLEKKLRDLRTTMEDLRMVQTFGPSNVKIYRLDKWRTDHTAWDIVIATLSPPGACIEITLTPISPLSLPIVAFALDYYFSSGTGGTGITQPLVIALGPTTGGVQKWHAYLTCTTAYSNVKLAFSFFAVTNGTWSATQII